MYVLLNLDRMAFVAKHPDLYALANIAWLECPEAAIYIFPAGDKQCIGTHTDMELRMLFTNTTGVEDTIPMSPHAIIDNLAQLTEGLPVTKLDPIELEAQAAYIPRKEGEVSKRYRYIPGANRPIRVEELFEFPILTAQAPAPGAVKPAPPPPVAPANAPATPKKKAAPGPAVGGKQSKKQAIWAVADRLWSAEGSPSDKKQVLAIRKRAMDILEDEGVKRTSASSELGKWQKERVRS